MGVGLQGGDDLFPAIGVHHAQIPIRTCATLPRNVADDRLLCSLIRSDLIVKDEDISVEHSDDDQTEAYDDDLVPARVRALERGARGFVGGGNVILDLFDSGLAGGL